MHSRFPLLTPSSCFQAWSRGVLLAVNYVRAFFSTNTWKNAAPTVSTFRALKSVPAGGPEPPDPEPTGQKIVMVRAG